MTEPAARQPASSGSILWILLALTAATAEPILVKIGYRGAVRPFQLLVYRTIFAGLAMTVITRRFVWIGRAALRPVLLVSLLLLLTNGLTLLALRSLSAVTVIGVVKITPALVAIINRARGRELLPTKFWLGFGMCFVGATMTIGVDELRSALQPSALPVYGIVALALSVLSSAIYRTRLDVVLETIEPTIVSTYIFAINAALLVFALPWAMPVPSGALPVSAFIGIAAAVANVAFVAAIRTVGSTRMSIIDMLQRPLVIVIAVIALKEPVTLTQLAGVGLLLVGVHFARVKRAEPQRAVGSPPSESPAHRALATSREHRDVAGAAGDPLDTPGARG